MYSTPVQEKWNCVSHFAQDSGACELHLVEPNFLNAFNENTG